MQTFGKSTAALVAPFLNERQTEQWLKPLSLAQRVTILIEADADRLVDQINAEWHGHEGALHDFDFSDTTVVELPAPAFERVSRSGGGNA